MISLSRPLLLLAPLLLASGDSYAEESDSRVAAAIRSSLLGDAAAVSSMAQDFREEERAQNMPRPERLSTSVQLLALSTPEDLPKLREARRDLSGFPRTPQRRAFDRMLRRVEPRQHFREARADRRYETVRRIYNGIAVPFTSALQGQFFALLSLPFDAADELVAGRSFLTPEQRRELTTARRVIAQAPDSREAQQAASVVERYPPRRTNLAVLQARQSGQRAVEDGRLLAAEFWFDRAAFLRDLPPNDEGGYEAVERQLRREAMQRRQATVYLDGEVLARRASELMAYRELFRLALMPEAEGFFSGAERFRQTQGDSAFLPAVTAMEAALRQREGQRVAAVRLLRSLDDPSSRSWEARSQAFLERGEFRPQAPLAEAQSVIRARWRSYVFAGTDPEVIQRSFEAEEARLRRQSWVARARGLFIIDTFARVLFLPFTPPIPEPELLDAAASIQDANWWQTSAGQRWRRRVAQAERRERRFAAAAASYEMIGDERRARSNRHRAARAIERLGDESPDANVAVQSYERILNAYPNFRHLARVERSLEDARARQRSLASVSLDELRRLPELTTDGALPIPPEWLDGRRSNGEIGRDGVLLLVGGGITFRDRATGERMTLESTSTENRRAASLLEPRRRTMRVDTITREPLPRRKIPAAVDVGLFPGFDVFPSLVPLDPDLEERRLFR